MTVNIKQYLTIYCY